MGVWVGMSALARSAEMCPNSLRGGTPPGLFTAGVSLRTPRINPEGEEEGGRRWVVEGVAPGRVPRHRWGQPSGSPVQSPLGLPFCSSATIGWPTGSVSGRSPPHPPLSFDPRGSREAWALGGPKKGLSGTPCGAKPRGSGGAPPTNLILLRNQREHDHRRRRAVQHARARAAGAGGGGVGGEVGGVGGGCAWAAGPLVVPGRGLERDVLRSSKVTYGSAGSTCSGRAGHPLRWPISLPRDPGLPWGPPVGRQATEWLPTPAISGSALAVRLPVSPDSEGRPDQRSGATVLARLSPRRYAPQCAPHLGIPSSAGHPVAPSQTLRALPPGYNYSLRSGRRPSLEGIGPGGRPDRRLGVRAPRLAAGGVQDALRDRPWGGVWRRGLGGARRGPPGPPKWGPPGPPKRGVFGAPGGASRGGRKSRISRPGRRGPKIAKNRGEKSAKVAIFLNSFCPDWESY